MAEKIKQKITKKLSSERITKGFLLILVLLLPLFFGLGKIGLLDFNKQMLLVFVSLLALALWLYQGIFKGTFQVRFSALTTAIFVFLGVTLISTILSRWGWGSFWGWPLDASANLLNWICFSVFYLLFVNVFGKKGVFSIQTLLLVSAGLAGLIGLLQLSGNFLIPFAFTNSEVFNTVGTVNAWTVFLACLIPLVLAMISGNEKKPKTIGFIAGILILAALIVSNYWLAWVIVLIGTSIFLIFGFWRFRELGPRLLVIPMVLFSLALLFGIIQAPIPTILDTPIEVSPSFRATLDVSKKMMGNSIKDILLGWGPGTFRYGWSQFKSPALNQTIFWNLRLSKGYSNILEMLGTVGVLGTIAYLVIIGLAFYLGIKELIRLTKERNSKGWLPTVGIFSSFITVSILNFIYPFNFSLSWLWWFLLASIGVLVSRKIKIFEQVTESKAGFVISFFAILALIGGIFLFYLGGTRYLAEIKYGQAWTTTGGLEEIENLLISAIRLNPHQEIFWQDLSQTYLSAANLEIQKTDISNEEKTQRVSDFIAKSVAAVKRATEINSENVANWQVRGRIYREIIGWSQGAFDWAAASYERARELEPTNPFILLELARTNLVQANVLEGEATRAPYLNKAEEYLRQALEMKPDYAQAFYQMALLYQSQGKTVEAIDTLETIKQMGPFIAGYNPLQDVGLAFQLGLLYYWNNQPAEAQIELERAVTLNPNYANARYFLGLAYDDQGNADKAIEQFEFIAEFNPENELVKEILANLKAGRPALREVATEEETVPIEGESEGQ